tara:strand:- start:2582 stop:4789 length:2208 start_codon:yes stop_codon:yes gene_type:complete
MADVVWAGGTSTAAGTAANWTGGSLPGSGDVAVFRTGATRDCVWDASAIASLQGLKIEDDFNKILIFSATGTLNLTSAGLIIEKSGAISVTHASGFTFAFSGALPFTGNIESYVKIDSTNDTTLDTSFNGMFVDAASRTGMTFTFAIPTGVDVIMDDGVYPNLTLNAASGTCFFAMIYGAPFNNYGQVDIRNFTAGNSVEVRKAATTYFPVTNDYQKAFIFNGTLTINTDYFYTYRSSVTYVPQSAATYRFPADGETNFGGGANFYAQHYDVVIAQGDAAGTACLLDTGHILSCNSIRVLEGAVLVGPGEHPGSEIRSVRRPVIDGTWNFVQVADGIYSSNDPTPFFGVPQGGTGLTTTLKNGLLMGNDMNALLTDANLTFINSILHADEGLKISEVADPPDHVAGTGILWVHDDAPSNLYFTDDAGNDIALTNGGAVIGGGITALTGNVTASGSGSVAATIADEAVTYAKMQHVSATSRVLGRITGGAGDVEELTGANIRTIANVEDGADVTDATNVAAAGALMDSEVTNLAFVKGLTGGISNGNVLVANAAVVDDDFLRVDGTQIEGRSAAEVKADLDLEPADIITASLGAALTVVTLATSVSGFTSGAYTIAPMANVVKDVTSAWDTSNYYFTAPSAGIYQIEWSASIRYITTSHACVTRIQKDTGSGFALLAGGTTAHDSGAISNGTWTGELASGDKVALYVFHNGGSGKNLIGDSVAANFTHMGIRMVGT